VKPGKARAQTGRGGRLVCLDGRDARPSTTWPAPDKDTYEREEQRRFTILEAHWDLPIKTVELEK
jgi:hypothetical protein